MSSMSEPTAAQIQPTYVLVDGTRLPGQPIEVADYEDFKLRFEASLREGRLIDGLADTTIDLVPGAVAYITWSVAE